MNYRYLRFFKKAKEQAEKSDFKQKIGCVVIYKGQIISQGYNQKRTHPLQVKYDKARPEIQEGYINIHTLHAETSALFKIFNKNIKWKKVEIYIYRILKSKSFGLAKPCPSCEKLIKELGIRTIHYTSNNNSYITEKYMNF